MLTLTIHTIETAPEASRPVLQGIAEDLGTVPNFAAAIAASSALLDEVLALRGIPASWRTPDLSATPLPLIPLEFGPNDDATAAHRWTD